MRKINIKKIDFKDSEAKNKSKNYPNSGIFLANSDQGFCDLIFVDKTQEHVNYVCTEESFIEIFESQEKPETFEGLNQTAELIQESIKYDGDFILEFARILLNRK